MFRSAIVNLSCLVRYFRERPCIKWVLNLLVDWIKSCLNNSSRPNGEIFFLVEDKTNKRVRSLHSRGFSTLIASSSIVTLIKVNNSQKTLKCPKKKKITVIQPEDFNELEKQLAGSVLQNGCSEKFKIHENKRSSIFFFILLTKALHQGCFLWNFLKDFRTPRNGCSWNYPIK